jgi:hypothetical protein
MTREEFETALDAHRLWIQEWPNGKCRWYLVRRNGRTRTWKKDAARWEIPIKWKFRSTGRVNEKYPLEPTFKQEPGPDPDGYDYNW